jgi:hypothetical protein
MLLCAALAGIPLAAHAVSEKEYLMLEFTEPAAGELAQFEHWYQRVHIPELLGIPGIRGVRRYEVIKADTPESTLPHHVAMIEAEAEKWDGIARQLQALPAPTPALRSDSTAIIVYRASGPLMLASQVQGSTGPVPVAGRTLQTYTMFVSTNAAPGMDLEYNRWYDEQHVPDVLRIPGYRSARRYALEKVDKPGLSMTPYLVLFTLETYDLDATVAELKRRVRVGITRMTPAFGKGGHVYFLPALAPVATRQE